MKKVYKTKVDIWLIFAIIGFTVIPVVPLLIYDFSWIVFTIVSLIVLFATYILFDISYIISDNVLVVKCSKFSKITYDINQINIIKNTNSILSAPAASLDRIAIYFFKQRSPLIISPKDKMKFIEDLQSINQNIRFYY